MRRTYTRERYLDRVALIREHVPDASLTTDIIVGFPGESEADFAETLEVAEPGGLRQRLHVHLLSPASRPPEAARADRRDSYPHAVKVERMERLLEVVQRGAGERARRFHRAHAGGARGRPVAYGSRRPSAGARDTTRW